MLKCEKCGNEQEDGTIVCAKCNGNLEKISSYGSPNPITETKEIKSKMPASKCFVFIAVSIAVIGLIAGIIAGKAFPSIEIGYYGSAREVFNVSLFFSVWITSIIISLGFLGVSAMLRNQEKIIDYLEKH